jgi:hypothetical protein
VKFWPPVIIAFLDTSYEGKHDCEVPRWFEDVWRPQHYLAGRLKRTLGALKGGGEGVGEAGVKFWPPVIIAFLDTSYEGKHDSEAWLWSSQLISLSLK